MRRDVLVRFQRDVADLAERMDYGALGFATTAEKRALVEAAEVLRGTARGLGEVRLWLAIQQVGVYDSIEEVE